MFSTFENFANRTTSKTETQEQSKRPPEFGQSKTNFENGDRCPKTLFNCKFFAAKIIGTKVMQ